MKVCPLYLVGVRTGEVSSASARFFSQSTLCGVTGRTPVGWRDANVGNSSPKNAPGISIMRDRD